MRKYTLVLMILWLLMTIYTYITEQYIGTLIGIFFTIGHFFIYVLEKEGGK